MEKRKSPWTILLIFLFGILFLISSCKVLSIIIESHREKQEFDKLTKIAEDFFSVNSSVLYDRLKEQNSDFFGWISIENTPLNYPVMHTPEEPEHYLHRNFEGKTSRSGVPFLSASCFEGCGNYIIYGHHMKNGTMFASLLSYADKKYWEQHPVIRLDTSGGSGEYQILAAFYSQIYSQNDRGVFRYYEYIDVRDPAVFEEYMKQVRTAALYDTGIDAVCSDQLLTLSTCSYHTENGRFVIVARKAE